MDLLAALKLQIEWGADEALDEAPIDRSRAPAPPPGPSLAPVARPESRTPMARAGTPLVRAEQAAAAAHDVEALRAALAAFDDCALRDTAASLVFGEGEADARLMLVGDVPGTDEERAGRPFAGPAGAMLDRMLAGIGLDRSATRLAMLVPWRPPGGRPPSESEIALCLPFLLRHVALVHPRRLVLLGSLVVRSLIRGAGPRRRTRGTWIDLSLPGLSAPIPALPTASPAALMAGAAGRREAWADLRLLRRTLDRDLSGS